MLYLILPGSLNTENLDLRVSINLTNRFHVAVRLFSINTNLLEVYHECRSLIGYGTHYRFNKVTSVFYASVLLLIMNFLITLSKRLWIHSAIASKFIVNNRTDALKTDINLFFTITNCRIPGSRSLMRRMNFKFMCLPAY